MNEQKPAPDKFKIICRVQNGQYSEELRCNDMPRTAPFTPEEKRALELLHRFSPEERTRALCRETPDAVLVFRTDAMQLAEFDTLLHDPMLVLEKK